MNYENILRPGTEVKFKKQFANVHNGLIKAVWISSDGVLYQVVYFNAGHIEEPYLPREMFDVVETDPVPAGFRLNEHK
jgi:hypothetical protein